MRHDHLSHPFDVDADEAADVTQQFWGSSRGWVSREHPAHGDATPSDDPTGGARDDDTTGSLQAIRDGFRAFRPQRIARDDNTGQVERTRQHGVVSHRQAPAPRRPAAGEASLGQLADGWPDDDQPLDDSEHVEAQTELVPLSPIQPLADRIGLGAVDPLLVRIGMVVLVGVLLVPLALALRPSGEGAIGAVPAVGAMTNVVAPDDPSNAGNGSNGAVPEQPAPTPITSDTPAAAPPAPSPVDEPTSSGQVPADDSQADAASAPAATSQTSSADVGDVVQAIAPPVDEAASVSADAERFVPECPATYVAGSGDSWYRIADAAGVSPGALLDENLATVDTLILPGDDVCLPAGAVMPSQPTATTQPPATTTPASTTPATTSPATTTPATTQPPATSPPASAGEVQQIIRDVWPDELEEKALQVAWRESNYIPTAYNGWCCYGVFQIYWSVHVSWLDDYGIYSSSDLLDADKNIRAAYALYQRAGSWGPWGG